MRGRGWGRQPGPWLLSLSTCFPWGLARLGEGRRGSHTLAAEVKCQLLEKSRGGSK